MGYKKIDNFPAYTASTTGQRQVLKNLPRSHELSAVIVSLFGTVRGATAGSVGASTAKATPNDGSAAGGVNDAKTIANAVFSQMYLKRDGIEKAYNVTPVDLSILYGFQYQRSMLNQGELVSLRHGDAIPAFNATAAKFRIDMIFDFLLPWAETPNKCAPGTEQALLDGGWEASYDTVGTGLTTLALANGNVDVAVTKVELGVDINETPWPVVGPQFMAQKDSESTENYLRKDGKFMEIALYETSLPATLDAAVTAVSVKNDGKDKHVNAIPSQLAGAYNREQRPMDGVNPFDPARSCTPLGWGGGRRSSDELEYPVTLTPEGRNVFFQGSSATRNIVRHRILELAKNQAVVEAVMQLSGIDPTQRDWRSLPVRFPSGRRSAQPVDALFASRYVR